MYPDNLNNQPQGIDYLNQIATPPPAEGFDKKNQNHHRYFEFYRLDNPNCDICFFTRFYAKR